MHHTQHIEISHSHAQNVRETTNRLEYSRLVAMRNMSVPAKQSFTKKENIWYRRLRDDWRKILAKENSYRKYSITHRVTANITWIETSNANMSSFSPCHCQFIYLFRGWGAPHRNLTILLNIPSATTTGLRISIVQYFKRRAVRV